MQMNGQANAKKEHDAMEPQVSWRHMFMFQLTLHFAFQTAQPAGYMATNELLSLIIIVE